ncbi:MAG TPA: NUDIX domain-containing protein [Cyclobacteriaceae bacterium]|nr:NUDIX domain-containing protein [Cyclobacteriaceae bacterium]
MNLFVNDIPVIILKPGKQPDLGQFNAVVDVRKAPLTKADLINNVWVSNAKVAHLNIVLDLIDSKVPFGLRSLVISVDDYEAVKEFLKKRFRVVKAAGGLVRKKDRFLLIYRQKKWDLPKGKKESGERSRQTAMREVEEECNVKVKLGKKISTTWHTYTMNKHAMLKKTRWYSMELVDDSRMKPAVEEDIEELRWMNQKEVYHALENSYNSIRFVFEQYYEQTKAYKE